MLFQILNEKVNRESLDPREWRPVVPEGLAMIVMQATATDPQRRTHSARRFERQLRDWLNSRKASASAPLSKAFDPTTAPPPPRLVALPSPAVFPPPAEAPVGPSPAVLVGGGVVAFLVLVFVGALWAFQLPPPLERAVGGATVANCLKPGTRGEVVLQIRERAVVVESSTLPDAASTECVAARVAMQGWSSAGTARITLQFGR